MRTITITLPGGYYSPMKIGSMLAMAREIGEQLASILWGLEPGQEISISFKREED